MVSLSMEDRHTALIA